MPQIPPWIHAADPAGAFATGLQLSMQLQQAKDRKKQLAAMMDMRQQQAETARDRILEQTQNNIERLQETQRHHDQIAEYDNKLATVRQQLADLQGEKLTANEKDKKAKLLQQYEEFTKKLNATVQMAQDKNSTTLDVSDARNTTTAQGQTLLDQFRNKKLAQDSLLAGNRLQAADQKDATDDATKLTLGLMSKPVTPLDPADATTVGQSLANTIRSNFARAQAMKALGQTNQPVAAPAPAPAAPRVKVKDPNGKMFTIPAAQLDQAKQQGYVPVQ